MNLSLLLYFIFVLFLFLIEARNHVNRLCLAADITLVESGSAGYLGQVTVIRKVLSAIFVELHVYYHVPFGI